MSSCFISLKCYTVPMIGESGPNAPRTGFPVVGLAHWQCNAQQRALATARVATVAPAVGTRDVQQHVSTTSDACDVACGAAAGRWAARPGLTRPAAALGSSHLSPHHACRQVVRRASRPHYGRRAVAFPGGIDKKTTATPVCEVSRTDTTKSAFRSPCRRHVRQAAPCCSRRNEDENLAGGARSAPRKADFQGVCRVHQKLLLLHSQPLSALEGTQLATECPIPRPGTRAPGTIRRIPCTRRRASDRTNHGQ